MSNLAEIKRMSAEKLADERKEAAKISETTPVAMNDALAAFCLSLSPSQAKFIPVIEDPHGLFGWCSNGVSEKIRMDGGQHAFGWTIWEWPGVLWTAEFHDIWLSPQGELQDITPKLKREPHILFVHDSSYTQNFNFDDRPGNKRKRIYEVNTSEPVKSSITKLKSSQLQYESKRATKAGVTLEEWMQRKVPKDPMPKLIDSLIDACNEHEKYFDTLGIKWNDNG